MRPSIVFLCICISVQFPAYQCKPMPGSTEDVATTASPAEETLGKTQPPWLKFLKNKKTTANPATTESSVPEPIVPVPAKGTHGGKGATSLRDVDGIGAPPQSPTPSEMAQLANWLGIYLQPSGDILAQDRQQNPDSLYDEMYLDWMKRDLAGQGQPEQGEVTPAMDADPASAPMMPAPQPMLAYPGVMAPYGYLLPSLAGFKMNKVMLQAQMDAALAAYNITTTPKPYKLKLKITVPGNVDATQMGQLTSGLASALPAGSTFEMA